MVRDEDLGRSRGRELLIGYRSYLDNIGLLLLRLLAAASDALSKTCACLILREDLVPLTLDHEDGPIDQSSSELEVERLRICSGAYHPTCARLPCTKRTNNN